MARKLYTEDDVALCEEQLARYGQDYDVVLAISKEDRSVGKRRSWLKFCHNAYKKFNEYALVGVLNNRIYFKDSDKINGYKFVNLPGTKYRAITICNAEFSSIIAKNIGGYKLNYDKEKELYYIELINV